MKGKGLLPFLGVLGCTFTGLGGHLFDAAWRSATACNRTTQPTVRIEIWYGRSQKVGHLGEAQDDFNLLGHASDPENIESLTCSLNGGPEVPMSFRSFRRLVDDGDFNADIPVNLLRPGPNVVLVRLRDRRGFASTETVTIERRSGVRPLPVRIEWSKVRDPQDVGQYVDGKWGLEKNGLRTLQVGYDRLFLIGEKNWKDYEVTVPITINSVASTTGPSSGSNALGIVLRFTGHVVGGPRRWPAAQPKWGYQPLGAIGLLRWVNGADRPPVGQFFPGDSDRSVNYGEFAIRKGFTYVMKFACQTLPEANKGIGLTRYRFKIWPVDTREPATWDWEVTQASRYALRRGGALLLAHHVDATFGNVVIVGR
jgi:hypothetical protein